MGCPQEPPPPPLLVASPLQPGPSHMSYASYTQEVGKKGLAMLVCLTFRKIIEGMVKLAGCIVGKFLFGSHVIDF